MKRRTIALYGGTFDPVHEGHVRLVEKAQKHLRADLVFLIPCRLSPHKSDAVPPAAAGHRVEMLRLAMAGLSGVLLDACELEREGPSYSWQTAQHFREQYPDDRLVWILGADQWRAMPDWKHPERLAALVEFLVVARNGILLPERSGYRADFLEMEHPASSSAIREMLRSHTIVPEGWLAPQVAEYIRVHGLYQ